MGSLLPLAKTLSQFETQSVPLVVRLEGTNVALGRDIISKSGLPIATASSLDEAAKLVCTLANQ